MTDEQTVFGSDYPDGTNELVYFSWGEVKQVYCDEVEK